MNSDTSTSKFWSIRVIIPEKKLKRCKKELLLLDNRKRAQKKLVTIFRGILVAVVYTIIEDLIFFLI